MRWIATTADSAQVIELKPFRDRPFHQFVGNSMGVMALPVIEEGPVALGRHTADEQPAFVRRFDIDTAPDIVGSVEPSRHAEPPFVGQGNQSRGHTQLGVGKTDKSSRCRHQALLIGR